jgi:hypothetical protein
MMQGYVAGYLPIFFEEPKTCAHAGFPLFWKKKAAAAAAAAAASMSLD